MSPTGPWVIDYAQSMCVLSREYAAGTQKLTLGFRPAPLGDSFRVALLFEDPSKKVTRGKAQVRLDRQAAIEAPFVRGPVKIEGVQIVAVDATRDQLAALGQTKALGITTGDLTVELALDEAAEALEALDACEKDLLVTWGMDPKIVASLASHPTQARGLISLFSPDDYPREAMRKKEQGTVGARIKVSKTGKVSDCTIIESSGSRPLDEKTCQIFHSRARFRPALTKDGVAVESIALQRIRWELPQ